MQQWTRYLDEMAQKKGYGFQTEIEKLYMNRDDITDDIKYSNLYLTLLEAYIKIICNITKSKRVLVKLNILKKEFP